jgi:hypothetical protein
LRASPMPARPGIRAAEATTMTLVFNRRIP